VRLRALLLIPLLAAAALPLADAADEPSAHVVVVGHEASGDYVNLTVTTATRSGELRSAGLYVGGSLASTQEGGIWLHPGSPTALSLRVHGLGRSAEFRAVFVVHEDGDETVFPEATPLTLDGGADVRPVRVSADGDNVTVELHNFGRAHARSLLVSLQDEAGAALSDPFFRRVPEVRGGASVEVPFRVAAFADPTTLVVESPHERTEFPVVAPGEGGSGSARLEADSPSVQGTPGSTVEYRLRLTNRGGERVFSLSTSGLPESYTATFTAQGSRVQTLRLGAGESKDLTLSVAVPAGAAANGTALSFSAVARSGSGRAEAALGLQPTGQPRLDLAGRSWLLASESRTVQASIVVRNPGTATAYDVAVAVEVPAGWTATVEPARVARIDPGAEATVAVTLEAPPSTADGQYVLDVNAQASGAVARERSLTLELTSPPPSRLPWVVGALLLAGGAAFLVVRMRRR
jgi:hypothetical protein